MDGNLEYIQAHFLSTDELAAESGVNRSGIASLIEQRILPRPAYFRGKDDLLTSNLGSSTDVLDDDYFPFSAIAHARHYQALIAAGADIDRLAACIKNDFIVRYENHLLNLADLGLVEPSAWQEQLATPEHRRVIAKKEYGHWIAGTYALCTRENSPEAVAVKECMVRSVDAITDGGVKDPDEVDTARLARYLELYEAVAALFAPFERPTSSRYRLCVAVAERYAIALQE